MFAAVPFLFEDDHVGLGDVERLVVHFGLRDVEGFGDAAGDDVAGDEGADVRGFAVSPIGREDAGGQGDDQVVAVDFGGGGEGIGALGDDVGLGVDGGDFQLVPLVSAHLAQGILRGPLIHGQHEGLGPVGGMEGDEGELAGLDAIEDFFREFFLHFTIADVAPPDQQVGVVEKFVGEALIGAVHFD